MKREFIFLLFINFILISCSSFSHFSQEFELKGRFVQKERNGIELYFYKDSFVYLNTYKQTHISPTICCDTLSYGTWKLDSRGFAVLKTPLKYNLPDWKPIEVVERRGFSSDSIYFIIDNPIEEFYVKNKWKTSDVAYKVFVFTQDESYHLPRKEQMDFTNKIVAPAGNKKITGFDITVLMNPEIQYKLKNAGATLLIETEAYSKKDPEANVFEIYIPDVNFEFMSFKRLNDDYVKIINKNKLLWDGKEYVRKR